MTAAAETKGGDGVFELLLLVIERDLEVMARAIPYIEHFLGPARITYVSPGPCMEKILSRGLVGEDGRLLDEDEISPGLNLPFVRSLIAARGGNPRRAGWYYKQIAIFAYAQRPEAWTHYLVWDADSIPVRPIPFFDDEGRVFLDKKREHHRAYFETIGRLTGMRKAVDFSFVAEHMLFERDLMRELNACILGGRDFDGRELAERIIGAVADEDISRSGFSEYETYGTFVAARHPERIAFRHLASTRYGTAFFGRAPSGAQLFAISTLFHWASFESWGFLSLFHKVLKAGAELVGAIWLAGATIFQPKGLARFKFENTNDLHDE